MTPLLNALTIALSLPLAQAHGHIYDVEQDLTASSMATKRVAIIGAGAGGSSAAYYLSQNAEQFGVKANITIFEKNPYIGGRTTTVHAWDDPNVPIELGASIFVEVNHILVSAVERFGLQIASTDRPKPQNAAELGIWNGKEFVLQARAEDGWWEKAKLLWRYGLAPIRTNSLMKKTVGTFLKMYEEPHFPWKSLSDVTYKLGLTAVTAATGEQFLKENGIGDLFATEVIQASTRVNYAQNLPLIHGLDTMVCMAANGAMAVEGGNWQIFSEMVKYTGANVNLNTTVRDIAKQNDGTYQISSKSDSATSESVETFDTVILAAPYQFSSISISPEALHTPDEIPYVQLHVTVFASQHQLSPQTFNLPPEETVPQFVLTTLQPGEHYGNSPDGVGHPGFFSISIVGGGLNPQSGKPEYIYKIFSPKSINSTFLSHILGVKGSPDEEDLPFKDVSWIHRKVWNSYPYEYPRVTFEEIKLDVGLFYTSGIESFISTMETSALMGKNVARLVVDEWVAERKEEEGGWERPNVQGQVPLRVEGQKPIKAKL